MMVQQQWLAWSSRESAGITETSECAVVVDVLEDEESKLTRFTQRQRRRIQLLPPSSYNIKLPTGQAKHSWRGTPASCCCCSSLLLCRLKTQHALRIRPSKTGLKSDFLHFLYVHGHLRVWLYVRAKTGTSWSKQTICTQKKFVKKKIRHVYCAMTSSYTLSA